jgi:sulfoxide reductase catalytic subunit YedY
MLIKKSADIRPSEITSRRLYLNRREFIRAMMESGAAGLAAAVWLLSVAYGHQAAERAQSALSTSGEELTLADVTTYNNYYEFGTGDGPERDRAQAAPNPVRVDRGRG